MSHMGMERISYSVLAENFRYLSFKYRKGQIKNPLHVQSTCQTIVELCNIRDGLSFCDGLNYSNIICILNALCLQ